MLAAAIYFRTNNLLPFQIWVLQKNKKLNNYLTPFCDLSTQINSSFHNLERIGHHSNPNFLFWLIFPHSKVRVSFLGKKRTRTICLKHVRNSDVYTLFLLKHTFFINVCLIITIPKANLKTFPSVTRLVSFREIRDVKLVIVNFQHYSLLGVRNPFRLCSWYNDSKTWLQYLSADIYLILGDNTTKITVL